MCARRAWSRLQEPFMKSAFRWAASVMAVAVVYFSGLGPDGPTVVQEAAAQTCPAIDVRPNFMIIFDTSGSMTQTIDADGDVITCTNNNQCLSNNCVNLTGGGRACACTSDTQ